MNITDYKNLYKAARMLNEAVDKNSKKYRSVIYKSNYYGFNNTEVNANCMHPFTIQLKSYLELNRTNHAHPPSIWQEVLCQYRCVGSFCI